MLRCGLARAFLVFACLTAVTVFLIPRSEARQDESARGAGTEQAIVRAVTQGPKFHWFSYYDVLQFDPTGRYLLGMEVDFEHRSPGPDDVVAIGMIDLEDNDRWIELGASRAWCWQQGCRLQWRPASGSAVLWNDRADGRFVGRILDVATGTLRTLPHPVYHVSPDGKTALGADFARINHMRPGYGYAGVPDANRDVGAPKNSGIYTIDLDTGAYTFLFSIADVAAIPYADAKPGDKHYFNHILWNPDGTRFLFLHRWRPEGGRGFRTRMFTADAGGKDIRLVTDRPQISHYTWRDPEHILIHRNGYHLYRDDGSGGETLILQAENGHQTYLPDKEWLLTDTYPRGERREQTVYLYHIRTGGTVTVGRFPSPKAYAGEWRVDTHPRLSPDGSRVVIDSAHGGAGRQMYLIDIKGLLAGRAAAADSGPRAEQNAGAGGDGDALSGAGAGADAAAGFRERALAWIEAEAAEPAPGIDVDLRKAAAASGGGVLGVHCDKAPGVACQWTFSLGDRLAAPCLAVRFAAEQGGSFDLLLDGAAAGRFSLPRTGGWGYEPREWQWGAAVLDGALDPGAHVLTLRAAAGAQPVNLDCLAVVPAGGLGPVHLPLEPAANFETAAAIDLASWKRPSGRQGTPFVLGAAAGKFKAWGRVSEEHRFHFPEFLPALFERTIVLERFDPGGRLDWMFTGERGGLTVSIREGEVRLAERFYDSFGFNRIADGPGRHPERQTFETVRAYTGGLASVTVKLDHCFNFTVVLNGRTALERECLFDISRHQLRLEGGEAGVSGEWLRPAPEPVKVRVDPSQRHQTMIGFGGIATPTAFDQLGEEGRRAWWRIVCEYNLLIQREYPMGRMLNPAMDNWERRADATPHYYGDNFPNGEVSDFDYIRTLRRLGGKVWFEFWALPPWVDGDPETYAAAMVRYCRESAERAGAPPDVVGIQNEVQQPVDMFRRMTLALRRALDEAGFEGVRIHMSDAGRLRSGIERVEAFKGDAEVWAAVDYSATHLYDYQEAFKDPDGYDALLEKWKSLTGDKPFLSTEICVNDRRYQRPSYRLALTMGQLYHKNLVLADAAAVCYCWTLLNVVQPSYGWTRTLFVPDPSNGFTPAPSSRQLRVFGAYSRRIHEGMVRVDAHSGAPDLLVCAFAGPGGAATLVALNRSVTPLSFRVEWPGVRFEAMELAGPYHANAVMDIAASREEGARVEVAPGSIVTLTNVALRELPAGF